MNSELESQYQNSKIESMFLYYFVTPYRVHKENATLNILSKILTGNLKCS